MFCKDVPITPKSSSSAHLRLGRGRSRDMSINITRKIDIEAEPEQAAFIIIISLSPDRVIMEIVVSPCVAGIKRLPMPYAICVESCAYGIPIYASCLLYTSDAADDLTRVDLGG